MRTRNIKLACLSIVLGILVFPGCTKKPDTLLNTQKEFSNNSLIRVYVATVTAASNNIYLDTKLLNGAVLAAGGVFPASGVYASAVPAGLNAFLVTGSGNQVPLSFAENMELNRNYTIFLYDTITTPKQKTVETKYEIPSDNTARIRFGNFTYAPTVAPAVDIFSARRNANIFSNVQLTEVTNFASVPADLTDTFYVRLAGTGVNLVNYNNQLQPVNISAILTPRAQRSYTLVFRGGYRSIYLSLPPTSTTTSNPHVRTLSLFTDR